MTDETSRDLRLEIAHVLFIDIIGYSKLLHNQQSEVFRELNEVVRGTEQFLSADGAGTLLRLPTGDGMALIFRESPEAPAKCALESASVSFCCAIDCCAVRWKHRWTQKALRFFHSKISATIRRTHSLPTASRTTS